MKIIKLTIFLLLSVVSLLNAQLSITVPNFSGSLLKPDMLWNVVVINQQEDFYGTIQLTVNDKENRNLITASSNEFYFPHGAKSVFFNNVSPVNYTVNTLGNGNDWLKVGKYFVCYSVNLISHNIKLAQECTELNIEPLSPPMLTEPTDKVSIYENRPVFSWIPPTPIQIFTDLNYEIKVVELNDGQSPIQAINNNSPIYFENGLRQPSKVLPASYPAFEVNHNYVWQVTAYDPNYSIKSEYWQFKLVKDSVQEILDRTPYVRLTTDKESITTMHQGNVKIVIENNTNDLTANLCLSEEGNSNCLFQMSVKLKPGENYFLKDISTLKLNEKKIYKLEWTNSRNEKFNVRYQPIYYK